MAEKRIDTMLSNGSAIDVADCRIDEEGRFNGLYDLTQWLADIYPREFDGKKRPLPKSKKRLRFCDSGKNAWVVSVGRYRVGFERKIYGALNGSLVNHQWFEPLDFFPELAKDNDDE